MGTCGWQSDTNMNEDPRSVSDQHNVSLLEFCEYILRMYSQFANNDSSNHFFLYYLSYKFLKHAQD